jgi:uncharacterized protein (TIGR02391 family)
MKLSDLIPDHEVLLALEPDELGLRMLPMFDRWPRHENLQLSTVLIIVVGHPQAIAQTPAAAGQYPQGPRTQISEAVTEAWYWLIGAALLLPDPQYSGGMMMVLSRRAKQLAKEPERRSAYGGRRLSREALHQDIKEDVWSLFHRGKYDTAVFEAMKAVEVSVRSAARLSDKDLGVPLMRKAFDKATGALTDQTMEEGEREARAHLFAGAIGSYKNPHSHRNVTLEDPGEAAEIIMLASHLLRIVETRAAALAGRH